jgi:nitronate monooxygenase
LRIPVGGAPLFIVSNPDLVIAQCKAGIVGSFPALNARPQSMLGRMAAPASPKELAPTTRDPRPPFAPFAVNQIVHTLQRPADAGHGHLPEVEGSRSSSLPWARSPR